MLAALVHSTIVPLVDVLVYAFRNATQDFCSTTDPGSEGLDSIPQINFASIFDDAGQNICTLFALRVGDDQNPAITDHTIHSTSFVVDMDAPGNASLVVKAIALGQTKIMFHFWGVGKASQPQLIVETIHIVCRGHVPIGTPAVWYIFNDTRMFEVGIVPLEELIDTAGSAQQPDKIVGRGIITPLDHVFQMPAILVCVVQSSLSNLVKIDQHHEVFDQRCCHHWLILVNRDNLFAFGNVVNHKTCTIGRRQSTPVPITFYVSIYSCLKG